MKLVIISGRSGSGKSTALNVLEDLGFYCIDNLPVGLLPNLLQQAQGNANSQNMAVSIDARNIPTELAHFADIVSKLDTSNCQLEIIYLDAHPDTLLTRLALPAANIRLQGLTFHCMKPSNKKA